MDNPHKEFQTSPSDGNVMPIQISNPIQITENSYMSMPQTMPYYPFALPLNETIVGDVHSDCSTTTEIQMNLFRCGNCGHGFTHDSDYRHHLSICTSGQILAIPESNSARGPGNTSPGTATKHGKTSLGNISKSAGKSTIIKSPTTPPSLNFVPPPSPPSPSSSNPSSTGMITCRYCEREYEASHIQNHELTHLLSSPDKPYFCNFCGRCFASDESCRKHEKIHTEPRPFHCSVCKKSFTSSGILKTHMISHSGEKSHQCKICKKFYSTAGNLKVHEVVHKGERKFPCSHCGKAFTTAGNLKTHEKIHIGLRPFACEVCDKQFTTAGNLKTHMSVHSGEKPFECDICHKSFTTAGNLRTHYRNHTGERPYVCDVCEETFMSAASLKAHQNSKHGSFSDKSSGNNKGKDIEVSQNVKSSKRNTLDGSNSGGDIGTFETNAANDRCADLKLSNSAQLNQPNIPQVKVISQTVPSLPGFKVSSSQVSAEDSESQQDVLSNFIEEFPVQIAGFKRLPEESVIGTGHAQKVTKLSVSTTKSQAQKIDDSYIVSANVDVKYVNVTPSYDRTSSFTVSNVHNSYNIPH